MIEGLKKALYFPLASYFRFFAAIRLKRWNPNIVVVTGSNGKTTLLHLLESQIGKKAKFSHHANSSYGIPFDVLGLERKTLRTSEWLDLFMRAPLCAFAPLPKEQLYIVEADCDRPGEGKFLAEFLQPEIVLWTSLSRTHSMNFDGLVAHGNFTTVEEAIAYEYGYFLQHCQKYAVIVGDNPLQQKQVGRTKTEVLSITKEKILQKYEVTKEGTSFHVNNTTYAFSALLPEEVSYALVMCRETVEHLGLPFDPSFKQFIIPPGRGSVFAGIKDTILIDSSYNANLGSIKAILAMFAKFPAKKKWVVIGDMMELGEEEKEEHEKLAEELNKMGLDRIILIGKRVKKYTYPQLASRANVVAFEIQKEVLPYLQETIQTGEAILFKGSQSIYLEGIIEPLLAKNEDIAKLPRRGDFWDEQRKKKGL